MVTGLVCDERCLRPHYNGCNRSCCLCSAQPPSPVLTRLTERPPGIEGKARSWTCQRWCSNPVLQVVDEEATRKAQEEADKKAAEEGKEAADKVEPVMKTEYKPKADWKVRARGQQDGGKLQVLCL